MGNSTEPKDFSAQNSSSGGLKIGSAHRGAAEYMTKAIYLHQAGKFEEAIDNYRQALSIQPDFIGAYFNLGLVFEKLGMIDSAVENYRMVISLSPDNADGWFNLGNMLKKQGRLQEAINCYRNALMIKPGDIESHYNMGNAFQDLGKLDEAASSYRKALVVSPNYVEALTNLGAVLQELGSLDEAHAVLRKALQMKPDHVEAINNLGVVFWRRGDIAGATAGFSNALAIRPEYAEAHSNLGNMLNKLGRFDEAIAAYRKAISLKPDDAKEYCYLGNVLRIQGKLVEAEECFLKALSIKPGLAEAHVGIAAVNIDMGQFDAARKALFRALEFEPEHHTAWALLSKTQKMKPDDDWLNTALRLVSDPNLLWEKVILLHFAIGKYYDDTGQYDLAFPAFQKANLLKRQVEQKFDRAGFSSLIDGLISIYDFDFMRRQFEGSSPSRLPVLIVGMPRSGTSLIEQIIASHPDAFGAGELSFWGEQIAIHQDMMLSGDFAPKRLARLAAEYHQCLRQYTTEATRVVDKMPGNFLWLGFIHAVFPQAKIIHTRRNPLDTCLSAYFQDLSAGHSYSTDLDDLAFYYREYDRIMRHWRSVFPADLLLEVSYEILTDNQAEWSRRIIEFIGLEWDEQCLDFHKTERKVGTSSNWQVRQKIYHSSKARWRNYERHVEPLLCLLDLDQGNLGRF